MSTLFPVLCHFDYDERDFADEQAAHNYKHLIIAVLGWCFVPKWPHTIHFTEQILLTESDGDHLLCL